MLKAVILFVNTHAMKGRVPTHMYVSNTQTSSPFTAAKISKMLSQVIHKRKRDTSKYLCVHS
jgi:hypothetical protein